MATEKSLLHVLNMVTTARLEALADGKRDAVGQLRQVLGSKNVVGVGIAEKISKGKPTGKLSLTFYVEKKIPLKRLRAATAVPPAVPEALSGRQAIPTDVIVLGKLRPEKNATRNPIQPGFSIGHIDITAGTLGAIVSRGKKHELLSNSHVLAKSGKAKKGDGILYPGKADGGKVPKDVAAKLARFKKFTTGGAFVNTVDAATAAAVPARAKDVKAEIKGLGVPRGTAKAKRGMEVVKVGRTTGKTNGKVRDVNFRFVLDYGKGVGSVGFKDQVLCTRYTKPGDSGSLVLDRKTVRAVGLHFAGASGG
ncbi:MAG: hypothetical protein HY660_02810, partial [Armatimonadetes bacterium]|nr:hypothetical protein [Armatimonadota bacterium]